LTQKPIIVQLKVGKGLSVQVAEGRWRKVYYGMIVDVQSADLQEVEEANNMAEAVIDKLISKHTGAAKPSSPTPIPLHDIPDLDIAEIQDAGWLTYQKNPCGPGQAGWVKNPVEFTSWKDPPQVLLRLVKAIHKTPDKRLVLGDMEYYLNKKFINRSPVKRESAR